MAKSALEEARETAVKRLQAQRQFKATLVSGVGVVLLMVVIWLLSGQGYFWPIWVMFGFGIALATTAWHAYGTPQAPITENEIQREVDRTR